MIVDDLSAMFYKGRGRQSGFGGVGRGVCVGGGGGGGGGGGRERERERESCSQNLFCFSTVLQVTAAEVRPIF